jgi:hypothetical protein
MRSRSIVLALICIVLATPVFAQQPPPRRPELHDSAESAKVAQWLRDMPPVAGEDNHFSVLGSMNFLSIGPDNHAFIMQHGVEAFYNDSPRIERTLEMIRQQSTQILSGQVEGGMTFIRDVQNTPWGMIEYAPGRIEFRILDTLVTASEAHGISYVGVAMPFAAWDLAGGQVSTSEMCQRLMTEDYFYLANGGVMERYHDLDAFIAWLAAVVERYDGDGIDDMKGLVNGIQYWQIHNEPEGDQCGLFRNDPAAFVELMRRSYETIKASCPTCQVLNGGAGIPQWINAAGSSFWRDFAEMGGGQYLDIVAVHYNNGKTDGGNEAHFATQLTALRALPDMDKPVWVTEFGVMVGPEGERFLRLGEVEAAAWYMRFYTVGLANGAERFFSDRVSFFAMRQNERLLPFYVNKLLEAKLGGFSAAETIAPGQYRFSVSGRDVYVVWTGIPAGVEGRVFDMYGREYAPGTILPSSANPLIIEIE